MRPLIGLAVVVCLPGCSSDGPETADLFTAPPAPTQGQEASSEVEATEVETTTTTTTSTAPDPEPFVGVGQIDAARRSDDGALVVTVTGYAWGAGPCEGIYEAVISDAAEMVVEVTEIVGPGPDGMCDDIGFGHALTVVGGAGFEGDTIVDAFDGSTIAIDANIEAIRPTWITDRPELPSCEIDSDDATPDANAARSCFRDAYDSRRPAELEVVSYGDEGETAHRLYRILDDQSLEVLEELRPPVDGDAMAGSPWIWQGHKCESFLFLDEPGFDIDGRPLLNADGECTVERTQF